MEQKIAVISESTIQVILETQSKILSLMENEKVSNSELVSVKEASKILKVSEQKIRQMIDAEELKHKRLGRTIRIYKSCLI